MKSLRITSLASLAIASLLSFGAKAQPGTVNNNYIGGMVFGTNGVQVRYTGTATLYQLGGTGYTQQVQLDSMGFQFRQVPSGSFTVLVELDPSHPDFATTSPTYFVSSYDWNSGPRINVNPNGPTANVVMNLLPIVADTGTGNVGGSVTGDSLVNSNARQQWTMEFNRNKAWVIATNTVTNQKYVSRVSGGSYNLANLPMGTYDVRLEYPRLAANSTRVTVGRNQSAAVNFNVNSAGQVNAVVTSLASRKANNLKVFPNPATDALNIALAEGDEISSLELHNATGQVVNVSSSRGSNGITLNTTGLSRGFYTVRLHTSAGQVMQQNFLKQ